MFSIATPAFAAGIAAFVAHPDSVLALSGWMAAACGIWLRARMPPEDDEVDEAILLASGIM